MASNHTLFWSACSTTDTLKSWKISLKYYIVLAEEGAKYTLKWYCRRLSTLVKIVLFVCILMWIHACVKEVGSLRKFLRRGCDLAESPSAMPLCWAGDKISKNIVGNHLPTIIIMENTRSTAHLYSWGVLRSCKLLQITLLTFKWELLNTFRYL